MTSKLSFLNIKCCSVIPFSDIAPSEQKEGRLKAGAAINGISDNHALKIEIIVLKAAHTLMCDTSVEIEENCIRMDNAGKLKRQTYRYNEISDSSLDKKRLAVGTKFFRGIQPTDSIMIILH